ncbi:unnamed protein product [Camellia sinensis]
MAASANPPGNNNQEGSGNGNGATNNGSSVLHDNAVVGPTQAALRHNPGLAVEWTSDEQSLLEDLLTKFGSERNIVRYAKIAMQLKDKTVRDVALRCRWLSKKENGKRRKDDHNSSRKSKDKKVTHAAHRSTGFPAVNFVQLRPLSNFSGSEKVTDSMAKSVSHAVNRSNGPPYAQPVISVDSDDGIPYKVIGGVTGQLLEQNAQALDQISANFTAFTIHENINLFCQARNNILTILNEGVTKGYIDAIKDMYNVFVTTIRSPTKDTSEFPIAIGLRQGYALGLNDMPEIMKQMPPLPVNLNEDLANSILGWSSLQKNS